MSGPHVRRQVLVTILSFAAASAQAQEFAFFRYDDDVSVLADPGRRTSWFDEIKYIPLGTDPRDYLSLGGDDRERIEYYENGYLGIKHYPNTAYELHRALVHADLKLQALRAFVQLGNYNEDNRRPGPIPTDINRGDVQQAFIDYHFMAGGGGVTVRAGRWEMKFGEGLIVSPREGPNIRQAWDGLYAFAEYDGWRVDTFAARPVIDKPGYFVDSPAQRQALWGTYLVAHPGLPGSYAVDAYYFGNVNNAVSLGVGPGHERTATFGGRLYGALGAFDSTQEVAYQVGQFSGRPVRAFAVHNEVGWTLRDATGRPRVGLRADLVSGNRDARKGNLGTFNALYPNFSYSTDAVIEAPANLKDVGLDLRANAGPDIDVQYTGQFLWRYSVNDAFYASPLFPLIPATASNDPYVGIEQQVAGNWRFNRHLNLRGSLVHFAASHFVTAAGGRDTNFGMAYVAARF